MRKLFFILLYFLSASFVFSQEKQAIDGLASGIRQMEKESGGEISAMIYDLSNNSILMDYNGKRLMSPASIQKLFISGSAFMEFDRNHFFETRLMITGQINAGVLEGDILIIGGGDPALGSSKIYGNPAMEEVLSQWTKAISKMGITKVKGSVVALNGYFEDAYGPSSWTWQDMGNYYAAPSPGLSFNDNLFHITFESKEPGSLTRVVKTEPAIEHLKLINEVTAGKPNSGDNAYVHGMPMSDTRIIRGTVPPHKKAFTIKASLPDPALFCAGILHNALTGKGIKIHGKPRTIRNESELNYGMASVETVYTNQSPPLFELIKRINQRSDNVYAENLLKHIGKLHGEGSTEFGLTVIRKNLKVAGIDQKMRLFDGSGLSTKNRVSAWVMGKWLSFLYQQSFFEDFKSTLAVSGQSGTLKYFTNNTAVEGRIYGKSGAIDGVRSYAGYYQSESGKYYAFCIMANWFEISSSSMKKKIANWVTGFDALP
jgi:serine-type D-Ala-D-Ala carboxypeptidase/endopeptidase (penicillin-binding protein 4)